MLFHPFLLTAALILFAVGAAVGFVSLKRRIATKSAEKSKHMYVVYSAYLLFLLALAVYAYERENVLTPAQMDAVRKSSFLIYHVVSIFAAAIFTTLTTLYGIIFRGTLFQEGMKKKEILHVLLGVLAVVSFAFGVATGVLLYIKAGISIL